MRRKKWGKTNKRVKMQTETVAVEVVVVVRYISAL